MPLNTAPERPAVMVGATRNAGVSFVGQLDSGELLTGAPTIAEVTTTDLTIANKAVSTSALVINNKTVIVGAAVTFTVSGQLAANSPYTMSIIVGTDAGNAQTLKVLVTFTATTE